MNVLDCKSFVTGLGDNGIGQHFIDFTKSTEQKLEEPYNDCQFIADETFYLNYYFLVVEKLSTRTNQVQSFVPCKLKGYSSIIFYSLNWDLENIYLNWFSWNQQKNLGIPFNYIIWNIDLQTIDFITWLI